MSQLLTRSPVALAAELEANGPTARLSRRAWHVLAALMRTVDPDQDNTVEISHRALATRAAYHSTRTVSRALIELADAGLIEHTAGGRVGHGTTEVRYSRMRVFVDVVETLLEDGRAMVALIRDRAFAITQARMRVLLDSRARRRARRRAVDNLSGLLDVALEEQKPRSPVMDKKSTSQPGPRPRPGGYRAPDPYVPEVCQHDWNLKHCKTCTPNGPRSAGTQR